MRGRRGKSAISQKKIEFTATFPLCLLHCRQDRIRNFTGMPRVAVSQQQDSFTRANKIR